VKLLKGIGRFVYDFVIGDDWKIAAAVVTALVIGALFTSTAAFAPDVLGPLVGVLLLLGFVVSVLIDVRKKTP
jgi:hypothetical protein